MKLTAPYREPRNAHTTATDRAVSPVIGVILMIAITVVLAAVVGSMALGLATSLQAVAPNANFQFEYTETGTDVYDVTATHMGGDTITSQNAQSLTISASGATSVSFDVSTGVSAGIAKTITGVSNDTAVRVVWTSGDGESSQTLATGRTPA